MTKTIHAQRNSEIRLAIESPRVKGIEIRYAGKKKVVCFT
jgi:hypothetical protein